MQRRTRRKAPINGGHKRTHGGVWRSAFRKYMKYSSMLKVGIVGSDCGCDRNCGFRKKWEKHRRKTNPIRWSQMVLSRPVNWQLMKQFFGFLQATRAFHKILKWWVIDIKSGRRWLPMILFFKKRNRLNKRCHENCSWRFRLHIIGSQFDRIIIWETLEHDGQ